MFRVQVMFFYPHKDKNFCRNRLFEIVPSYVFEEKPEPDGNRRRSQEDNLAGARERVRTDRAHNAYRHRHQKQERNYRNPKRRQHVFGDMFFFSLHFLFFQLARLDSFEGHFHG